MRTLPVARISHGYIPVIYQVACALTLLAPLATGCDSSNNGPTNDTISGAGTTTASAGTGATTTGAGGSPTVGASGKTTTNAGGTKATGKSGSGAKATGGKGGAAAKGTGGKGGSGAGTKANAGSSANPGAAPRPSPGCTNGTVKAGNTTEMMGSFQYVQHVPNSYDGKTPHSLIVDLHGGTYDGPRWDTRNGKGNPFKDMAETEHFILLSPTSSVAMGMWEATGPQSADGDLIRDLVTSVKKNACIDERRVYATGCSMGGAMSFWLACFASDYITAVVPMCGTVFFELTECQPTRPVSMMFIMGSQDAMNCWEPPRPANPGNPCASEVLEGFKRANGCTDEWEETHDGLCRTHDQCKEGTESTVCLLNTTHMGIYEAADMNVYKEGWNFLKQFYIH